MTELERRRVTYRFLLAFLLGAAFGALLPDPIDPLFFALIQGEPAPGEVIIYYYFLPALAWMAFFALAYIAYRRHVLSAQAFSYILVFILAISFAKALEVLNPGFLDALLLAIPFILAVMVLLGFRLRQT